MRPISSAAVLVALVLASQSTIAPVPLPNRPDSFKFAVFGNSGSGDPAQYELAGQMATLRERFKFDHVLLLGDNVHGSERPQDFVKKFEAPYKRLLDGGVTFHAALGNEDSREQRYFKNFNMNGNLYYTFEPRPDIQLVALESTYADKEQVAWLEGKLRDSPAPWKIVYLHHPLYSSGRQHGSNLSLRGLFQPLFVTHNVSAVFSAHDRVYERTTPQQGITHFVVGSAGKIERGGIEPKSGFTARAFDEDLAFLAVEIAGDQMHFNAISRTGQIVDSGVLPRRK